ncbi:uncharacterized protein Hap1MRO34_002430 [Clarias gariepinus]
MEVSMMRYTWAALCITVFMMPGSVKSEEATNSSSAFELIMDITNRIYNDSLLKPGSTDYDALSKDINNMLYSIFGCTRCHTHSFYHNVSALTFSNKTGSVLVNATLLFQSNKTSARVIEDLFMNATEHSIEIAGLKINHNFTQVIPLPTIAPTDSSIDHPGIHLTTKHHSGASSLNRSPITLTSFLRYSVSLCLLFLISYSF